METTGQQFIAGKRRSGTSGKQNSVTNPATGEVLAVGNLAGAEDVDEAVAAARAAYAEWSRTTPVERSEALLRWVDLCIHSGFGFQRGDISRLIK
ncbi:aldehyde dehydrogenase family protein [Streptomyces sp. NPDC002851]